MAQVTSNLYTRIPAELNEKLETYLKETGETNHVGRLGRILKK